MKKIKPQRLLGLIALLLLLLTAGRAGAQAPTWDWAISPGLGTGNNTAVDAAGNVYVTGSFSDTATFGTTTLISGGGTDLFVAKLTPAGAYDWVVQAGGADLDVSQRVILDNGGNVYVTGYLYSPTASFGAITLTNHASNGGIFVAKLNPAGGWQWATGAGDAGYYHGHGLAVDGNGSVYVSGDFSGSPLTLGATTLTNNGQWDTYVAKLTPAGAWQWAVSAGGSESEFCFGLALDNSGNAYITGSFSSDSVSFGATTLAASGGGNDAFVAKLDSVGTWQWAASTGGGAVGSAVAVSSTGNVYLAGSFFGDTVTFGSSTLINGSGPVATLAYDAFVAQLSPTGVWQWAEPIGGFSSEFGAALAVDSGNNLYVTGNFSSQSATFGTATLSNSGAGNPGVVDLFVAKLTPARTWEWAVGASSSGDEQGLGIAVDGNSNLYLTGSFSDVTAVFGSTTLTSSSTTSQSSSFIARLGFNSLGLAAGNTTPIFTLAPNPAHHTATLTGAPGPTVTLLDALGRTVRTVPLTNGDATLDVHGLPAGLYLVRAGQATRRLVVE